MNPIDVSLSHPDYCRCTCCIHVVRRNLAAGRLDAEAEAAEVETHTDA